MQTENSNSRITIGESSFALAARYGTPAGYELQGDYMNLTYGSDAAACRLIVLVDQDQRVAGWASTGAQSQDCANSTTLPSAFVVRSKPAKVNFPSFAQTMCGSSSSI